MADNVIGQLLVNLGLNTARLKSDSTKAQGHFKSMERGASRSMRNIRSAAAALGVGLSVVGFASFAKRAIDTADKIGKLSTRLGASTEALSEYRHVAELSGVTFQTLSMGWQRMTRRVAEAANGTGEAKDALIELNVSAQDLNRLKPEQQFEILSDALMGVENSADQVRLAMKLFDSEGVSLLQTMQQGSAGLREMRDEARDLGLSLSKDTTDSAAKANDAITRLKAQGEALGFSLARVLGPTLADLAGWLAKTLPEAVQVSHNAFSRFLNYISGDIEKSGIRPVEHLTGKINALEKRIRLLNETIENPNTQTDIAANLKKGMPALNAQLAEYSALLKDTVKRQGEFNQKFAATEEFKSSIDLSPPPTVGGADGQTSRDSAAANAQAQLEKQMAMRLESVELSLMTEEERLFESYARRNLIIEDARDQNLISDERHAELAAQLAADLEKKLTKTKITGLKERNRFTALLEAKSIKGTLRGLQELTSGVTSQNKTMFRINKYAAIAEATMNTYAAANKAMAQGGIWGYAMAGLIIAAGLSNVQQINSQQFGGSSSGGATGGSFGAIAGGPDSIVNDLPLDDTVSAPAQGSQITINIDGNVFANDDWREAIVEAIEQAEANDEIRIRNVS